jgi:acyl carrier protein phosphodiesterase
MKIGNFMADGILGKHFETFPIEIQRGIILHSNRYLTDAHPF